MLFASAQARAIEEKTINSAAVLLAGFKTLTS
jgi:hypothetical protein